MNVCYRPGGNYESNPKMGIGDPAAGRDVIIGWEAGDKLDLSGLDANSSEAGNQDFIFAGEGASNNVVSQGQMKFYHYGGDTYVVLNQTADKDRGL